MDNLKTFDYYAGLAMQNAVSEIQETVPASFWDFIKILAKNLLHFHWLEIRYKEINGVKEEVAHRACKMAALMMKERENYEEYIHSQSKPQ